MNGDPFFIHWPKHKHKAKERWIKLTDEDIAEVEHREHLIFALQKRYGFERKQAIDEFMHWWENEDAEKEEED